jgi:hypothetical protein
MDDQPPDMPLDCPTFLVTGSYRSDFHAFNFTTSSWAPVACAGRLPRARYRATVCVRENLLFLFGGHDGTKHLNDVNLFNFDKRQWSTLATVRIDPHSHTSRYSIKGCAMNDFC